MRSSPFRALQMCLTLKTIKRDGCYEVEKKVACSNNCIRRALACPPESFPAHDAAADSPQLRHDAPIVLARTSARSRNLFAAERSVTKKSFDNIFATVPAATANLLLPFAEEASRNHFPSVSARRLLRGVVAPATP